jgi:hypothetical protein
VLLPPLLPPESPLRLDKLLCPPLEPPEDDVSDCPPDELLLDPSLPPLLLLDREPD